MQSLTLLEPVDYLIIGHLTQDKTPEGMRLGGTASFASLTAKAAGLRVGIVTACAFEQEFPELEGIRIVARRDGHSTTFENIYTSSGRVQWVHHLAPQLDIHLVPDAWTGTPIVHLAPIAQEMESDERWAKKFPHSLIGITPQGWMRTWDEAGRVRYCRWENNSSVLKGAEAVVFSIEDVSGDEKIIEEIQTQVKILVVTEGALGARLYWNGELRYFRPPEMQEVDAVRAGDIFAAAFFIRHFQTRNPWEAARFATQIAATSVTRQGLEGIPRPDEVRAHLVEVV